MSQHNAHRMHRMNTGNTGCTQDGPNECVGVGKKYHWSIDTATQ